MKILRRESINSVGVLCKPLFGSCFVSSLIFFSHCYYFQLKTSQQEDNPCLFFVAFSFIWCIAMYHELMPGLSPIFEIEPYKTYIIIYGESQNIRKLCQCCAWDKVPRLVNLSVLLR